MTSDSVQVFRQTDLKQKEIGKSTCQNDQFYEGGKTSQSSSCAAEQKSTKRFKSPKKYQECKKSIRDAKIEDVFLNSEYFKHRTNNLSYLSFCSGDNEEHRWTIDSNFEIPSRQKSPKKCSYSEGTVKNNANIMAEKERNSTSINPSGKSKTPNCYLRKNAQDKTEKLLEEIILPGEKGRVDQDLITLITEQMFLAERELQITRTHLIETISKLNERDLEIIQLHEKLKNLQKIESNSSGDHSNGKSKTSEDYQRLVLASEKLKKQVKDMEDFLNDYGLIWVGDKASKPDFDTIIKSFQRLNAVASQPKIIQTTLGAKFELPRELPIIFYSNGILLQGNDFREYNKISTHLFLQDVEDGYFPSELQAEYPEGVPFEVVDKRNELYNKNSELQIFNGNGNRLGSTFEDKPASMVFLEPVKESKSHSSSAITNSDPCDKCLLRKSQKKRSRSTYFQEDNSKNRLTRHVNPFGENESIFPANSSPEAENQGKSLTLKIRYGKERTESFVFQMRDTDRLIKFQDCLNRKLCERYHKECLIDVEESAVSRTDFEIHVYGKPPFRLMDNLHRRLGELGIVENCVVNVTEI